MAEPDQSDHERVHDLEGRIKAAQKPADVPDDTAALASGRDALSAGRVGFEFMGAVLAGIGLGWLIDGQFGTSPWGTLVGLVSGFVAGIANARRQLSGVTQAIGRRDAPKKKPH